MPVKCMREQPTCLRWLRTGAVGVTPTHACSMYITCFSLCSWCNSQTFYFFFHILILTGQFSSPQRASCFFEQAPRLPFEKWGQFEWLTEAVMTTSLQPIIAHAERIYCVFWCFWCTMWAGSGPDTSSCQVVIFFDYSATVYNSSYLEAHYWVLQRPKIPHGAACDVARGEKSCPLMGRNPKQVLESWWTELCCKRRWK